MSEATLTFRIVGPARFRGLAKALLVFLLGAAGGYAITLQSQENLERAETLTFEEYSAGYEDYKADLAAEVMSPTAGYLGAWVALGLIFSLYEVLASGLAWLMRRVEGGRGRRPIPPHAEPAERLEP